MLRAGDRLLGGDPVYHSQAGAKRVVLMNCGADQQLAAAVVAWFNAKIAAEKAMIHAESSYVSAMEGARRLCLPSKRQFIALMKTWGIKEAYLSQNRRRWRWDKIEAALQKRELPSSRKPESEFKIAA